MRDGLCTVVVADLCIQYPSDLSPFCSSPDVFTHSVFEVRLKPFKHHKRLLLLPANRVTCMGDDEAVRRLAAPPQARQ
jgi:hypothetical protein